MPNSVRTLADVDVRPGARVLVRTDLNVPLRAPHDGAPVEITDDLRIRAVLPTIETLLRRDATVLVCSHLGRPKGTVRAELSLGPVARRLGELLGRPVPLAPGPVVSAAGDAVDDWARGLAAGQVGMLENLRFDPGEETNDGAFAAGLAAVADLYVNDAFGSCHRSHASVDAICDLLPHAAGLLVEAELRAFERLLHNPPRPFVAILGGAKVSDKLGVIDALLGRVDTLLIGGAMCFTFAKAQGGAVGASLVEDDRIPDVQAAVRQADELGKKLVLPSDVVCAEQIASDAPTQTTAPGAVPDGWMGLDIGPATVATFADEVTGAGAVLWNGPMGVFETPPFDAGTRGVAEAVAASPAYSVVGGGDSAAALRQLGLADSVDHLSTGGGASLELIEHGDLPGLAALRREDPA